MVFTSFAQDVPTRRKGSRIIDDTTKQIYGPRTSRFYFEQDVFYNRQQYYTVDTLIKNFHRFNFVQRNNNLYQDLGQVGTSIYPIYYQTPEIIGVTSGFHSFDLYWDSEPVKYYDTKSPFSNFKVIIGGRGRNLTSVAFSRNINPRWNFGFDFRRMLTDKVNRKGKGDRNVRSTYLDVYTGYKNKDSTYRLFVNIRNHQYQANENGGIQEEINTKADTVLSNPFSIDAIPLLSTTLSKEKRMNIHLFHQYQVFGKGFQLYHVFDSYSQNNAFTDAATDLKDSYFDYVNRRVDTTDVNDDTRFKTLRNEVGIKGNLAKLFYNGYYALRNYNMNYKYLSQTDVNFSLKGAEHYLGGRMSLFLDSIGEVNGWAELEARGNYRIEGNIKSKWFEASLKELQYEPSFLLQAYSGSHDFWNSRLRAVQSTQLNGYLHYHSKILNVSPGLTFTRLTNYAYFKKDTFGVNEPQQVMPAQSTGTQVIASPELRFSLTVLRHITFSSQTIYTRVLQNDDNVISMPELFVNGQVSYANIFFHGNMDMHAGVDIHWKSSYKAMGYDPVIQQFYRQDVKSISDFPVVDIFFNMKVKRGRIFIKYNNLVQAFTKKGYLTTRSYNTPAEPNSATPVILGVYPGQRNVLDFGFDLSLYD